MLNQINVNFIYFVSLIFVLCYVFTIFNYRRKIKVLKCKIKNLEKLVSESTNEKNNLNSRIHQLEKKLHSDKKSKIKQFFKKIIVKIKSLLSKFRFKKQ